ncbi:hypothetical protein TNCV_1090991 [Trichonephila clavipes]|uniref:Uncharacterized protein n=1 Tax=Trichonephila clavipes TaxID=2585209 RepID=A0A8X6SS93_TRICX|nr:hypothetical protein TNCV_1090991 [Trichonephila clavipes]
MECFLEQRYTIKFCVKLRETGKETTDMVKEAYSDAVMGRSVVFEYPDDEIESKVSLFRAMLMCKEGAGEKEIPKDEFGRPM